MDITHQQLAEILAGVARAHAAVINTVCNKATVDKKIRPALRWQGGIRGDPAQPATLENLYSRMLHLALNDHHPAFHTVRDFFAPTLEELIPKEEPPIRHHS